jgi:hypothetical protein
MELSTAPATDGKVVDPNARESAEILTLHHHNQTEADTQGTGGGAASHDTQESADTVPTASTVQATEPPIPVPPGGKTNLTAEVVFNQILCLRARDPLRDKILNGQKLPDQLDGPN